MSILTSWVKKIITQELDQRSLEHAVQIIKLDKNAQYLISVPDDKTAEALTAELTKRFSTDLHVVIVATPEMRLLEIQRRKA